MTYFKYKWYDGDPYVKVILMTSQNMRDWVIAGAFILRKTEWLDLIHNDANKVLFIEQAQTERKDGT